MNSHYNYFLIKMWKGVSLLKFEIFFNFNFVDLYLHFEASDILGGWGRQVLIQLRDPMHGVMVSN